jgi:hypothetical protein
MGSRITLNSTLTTGPFILLFGSSASQPISSPLVPQLNLKESMVFSFIRSAFFCTGLDNTAPICLSLSLSLEPGNCLHKYLYSSQVDSSVSKLDHLTNTSATALLFFFVSLVIFLKSQSVQFLSSPQYLLLVMYHKHCYVAHDIS